MTLEAASVVALIFFARCTDVTVGVFRILMVVQGRRYIAAVLGFFEVMIFLTIMGVIFGGGKSLSIPEVLAYCGGFATGNLLGSFLEQKLMDSYVMVEIIAERDERSEKMTTALRAAGFGLTVIQGEGRSGPRLDIKVICSRKQINQARGISNEYGGFFFVSDIRSVSGGFFVNAKRK